MTRNILTLCAASMLMLGTPALGSESVWDQYWSFVEERSAAPEQQNYPEIVDALDAYEDYAVLRYPLGEGFAELKWSAELERLEVWRNGTMLASGEGLDEWGRPTLVTDDYSAWVDMLPGPQQ